ncbi:MAG TPA: peroxiredoxin [Candidatus Saccharimonadales bacterium]|nr:peroxiredoxin [Candidatus Saccharimonadales bacterium]
MFKKLAVVLLSAVLLATQIYSKNNVLGKPAPLFKAKAVYPDGSIRDFDLQDYIGSDFILYFYPFDNTPGCTKQAQIFRDSIKRLQDQNLQVIGVSCDAPASHKRFSQKLHLPYPLVSDTRIKRDISMKYGAVGFFHSKRKTFLVNKKGIVFKVFENVDIENQIDDILKSFKEERQRK